MFDVMRKAAQLSKNDQSTFVDLVGMAFSSPPYKNTERAALGTSYNPAGAMLERMYERLVHGRASSSYSGFNPNIADVEPSSTITHHFREFLLAAHRNGKGIAFIANESGDDTPQGNPGDLRNGYFASMIGDGLARKRISVNEAVALTEWAYKLHSGKAPTWDNVAFKFGTRNGSQTEGDYYLDTRQYEIEDWLRDYGERNSR
ncbi:hypothetical protein BH10CYA1_BH10CYA1_61680 [soil metagenome]